MKGGGLSTNYQESLPRYIYLRSQPWAIIIFSLSKIPPIAVLAPKVAVICNPYYSNYL